MRFLFASNPFAPAASRSYRTAAAPAALAVPSATNAKDAVTSLTGLPAYAPNSYKATLSTDQKRRLAKSGAGYPAPRTPRTMHKLLDRAADFLRDGASDKALALLQPHETSELARVPAYQYWLARSYRARAKHLESAPTRNGFSFSADVTKNWLNPTLHDDFLSLTAGALEAAAAEMALLQHPSVRARLYEHGGFELVAQTERQSQRVLDLALKQALKRIASIGEMAADQSARGFNRTSLGYSNSPQQAQAIYDATKPIRKQLSRAGVDPAPFWQKWTQTEQMKFLYSAELEAALPYLRDGRF